jgi:hypothetical protein
MGTIFLLLPPLVNVLVTGIFAGVILRQYIQRRRSQQLYWSLAMIMAFLATLAYMGMVISGPTSAIGTLLFRLYYMLGGTIMPSWLGLGSIALLGKPRLTRVCAGLLMVFSVISGIFVLDATINMTQLRQIVGTPGTGTLQPGPWLVMTILLNTLGVIAVAGVALYSGWNMWRHRISMGDMKTINILRANICIFIGAILNAAAGTMARVLGISNTFWLIMALGWIVLFMGVLLAGHRTKRTRTATTPDKETTSLKA